MLTQHAGLLGRDYPTLLLVEYTRWANVVAPGFTSWDAVFAMRSHLVSIVLAFLLFAMEGDVQGDVISDFVTLGRGTPISANNGSNSSATQLSDLTGGNEATQATVSRTFTDNATFGSFVIDFTITASLVFQDQPANIGVDFSGATNGIGVGTDKNVNTGERLAFATAGIDVSALNAGYAVAGYGIESVRFAAANNAFDSGGVDWGAGTTGGPLGNVPAPSMAVLWVDMDDGGGPEESYVFEDPIGGGMFTWDFSQDDQNGTGSVTNQAVIWNNSNGPAWWLNRINLVADVTAVPEPSTCLLFSCAALMAFLWRGRAATSQRSE